MFLEATAIKTKTEELQLINITVGQLKDGIDKFYEDFANRRIKLVDAVYIVKMQIKGVRPDLIEAQTRYLRMQPTSLSEENKIWDKAPSKWSKEFEEKTGLSKEYFLRRGIFYDEAGEMHFLFRYGIYK